MEFLSKLSVEVVELVSSYFEPRITSELGWYGLKEFVVTSFLVEKINGGSLLNPIALARIKLDGVTSPGYEFSKLHISKRFELVNEEQIAIITVTPFVTFKGTQESNTFYETTETTIPMWKYGENKVIFVCGNNKHKTSFLQTK